MYNGLMPRWNVFGAVLMLSAALLNTSCSSPRQVLKSERQKTQIEETTTRQEETQTIQEQEQTHEKACETVTVTDIVIYDTKVPTNPQTGEHPVQARIRQRTDRTGTSRDVTTYRAEENTETEETKVYSGGELSEAVVVAERPPSLWERIKKGVMWGVAVIILAAAGWIIYKLKK